MAYEFKHSILGGTFDHLHIGHKKFIDTAFRLSEKLSIGLSTEKLYRQKFLSSLIDSYKNREQELKEYLKRKNYLSRSEIIPLEDIFGPSLTTKNIDAVFVTQTTLSNAQAINQERFKKGLPQMEIVTVPFVKDASGEVITSERIRFGEIDRDGQIYMKLFNKEKLNLPQNLRSELRKPVGAVTSDMAKIKTNISGMLEDSLLITVGDIVTKSLRDINCIPDIEIIDFKTRRSSIDDNLIDRYKKTGRKIYINEPGYINKEVVEVYLKAIKDNIDTGKKTTIMIEGEEDLLTLPAILLSPLHSYVYYGQFDLNAVIQVEVTEEKKQLVAGLLEKFI